MDTSSDKKIRQLKIKAKNTQMPFLFMSPYELLEKMQAAIKGQYDLEFLQIKYQLNKCKALKDFEGKVSIDLLKSDYKYNHIFGNPAYVDLIQDVFCDAVELKPPQDYNPKQLQQQLQREKQLQEEGRLEKIKQTLVKLMKILQSNGDIPEMKQLRSLESFKKELNFNTTGSDISIYAKVKISQAVFDKIQQVKNANKATQIKHKNKSLKLYLHPVNGFEQPLANLVQTSRITDWSLGTYLQGKSYYYYGTSELEKIISKQQMSIKLINEMGINEPDNFLDSFDIYSFMFNETLLRMNISLAQIIFMGSTSHDSTNFHKTYYMKLKYPPKMYITIIKPDLATKQNYNHNWQRVDNFMFLKSKYISNNELLRLFLFNNTYLRITLNQNQSFGANLSLSQFKLDRILKIVQKNQSSSQMQLPPFKSKISLLDKVINYSSFLSVFELEKKERQKIWKIKYFMMVLVRYGYLNPIHCPKILSDIQDNFQKIDIFLYILWKTAAQARDIYDEKFGFYDHLKKEFEKMKDINARFLLALSSQNTELIAYIYRVALTPSGYLYGPPSPQMKGRILKQYSDESELFLRMNISDDNGVTLKNQKFITKKTFRQMLSKINILDRNYIPLGWSSSQLRSYSLWFIHEMKQPMGKYKGRFERHYILSFLGDFTKVKGDAKKAARIGQSFSASWTYKVGRVTQKVQPDRYSNNGYLFTDGIGRISSNIIRDISIKLNIKNLSIIQVRYKGAKGVLVQDKSLPNQTIVLRDSMVKYTCQHEKAQSYLDILDWNKYKPGTLNRQTIILLRTLGVTNEIFLKLQAQHIQNIQALSFKDCSVFTQLYTDLNTEVCNLQPANKIILKLIKNGFKLDQQPFFKGVLKTMKKNGYYQLKVKSNMLIKKSARIIGIVDQYKILEDKEVYCSVLNEMQAQPKIETVQGKVIVTRNPCLDPADIRILKAVGQQQIKRRFQQIGIKTNLFAPYVNSVIFPMKGQIPVTAQISGSDLDGDNFFICWDQRLIPPKQASMKMIDQPPKTQKSQDMTYELSYEKMLDFFIEYLNYQKLGQIDNSHLIHADKDLINYANNDICKKLSEIHGKAVDFPKTGTCPYVDPKLLCSQYPDFMEKKNMQTYKSQSILGLLYRDVKQKIESIFSENKTEYQEGDIDPDLLFKVELNYSIEDIRTCFRNLTSYSEDITSLIDMIGVDNEYEIYTGNFSTVKDKVDSFGKSRLIATIIRMRTKYFDLFFGEQYPQKQIYLSESNQEEEAQKEIFFEGTRKRALLYYIVSYLYKFQSIKIEKFPGGEQFKKKFQQVLDEQQKLNMFSQNNKFGFCGFVWFVIPKIIINIKNISIRHQRLLQQGQQAGEIQNVNNNNLIEQQNDYDQGAI